VTASVFRIVMNFVNSNFYSSRQFQDFNFISNNQAKGCTAS
jgi:hypothetical protein